MIVSGLLFYLALATSGRSCDASPEWAGALTRYHLFALLMFGGVFGLIVLDHIVFMATFGHSSRPWARASSPAIYLGGLGPTLLACGFWARFTYGQAVAHLRRLQREVAVQIARRELARSGILVTSVSGAGSR